MTDHISDWRVSGLRHSPRHPVVSLEKKLCLALSLSTQVNKMGAGDILLGKPCDGLASHPGRSGNTLGIASCYRNRDKLWPCGTPWLICDFTIKWQANLDISMHEPQVQNRSLVFIVPNNLSMEQAAKEIKSRVKWALKNVFSPRFCLSFVLCFVHCFWDGWEANLIHYMYLSIHLMKSTASLQMMSGGIVN